MTTENYSLGNALLLFFFSKRSDWSLEYATFHEDRCIIIMSRKAKAL